KIRQKFTQNPDAGMLGVLGSSCNRDLCTFYSDREVANMIDVMLPIARSLAEKRPEVIAKLSSLGIKTQNQIHSFATICEQISTITSIRFYGEHCQGGAYAVSGEMVDRMFMRGLFKDPLLWAEMPLNEDRMMGIHCAAVGLRSVDFSRFSQPFGVQ